MNTTSPKAEILNRRRLDASIGYSSSHPQATCLGSQLENIDRAVTFWHQAVAQWSSPPISTVPNLLNLLLLQAWHSTRCLGALVVV